MSNSPQKMPRKKVAVFTTCTGHLSIAEALKDVLQENYDVVMYYDKQAISPLYFVFYQFFPTAFKVPFTLTQNDTIKQVIEKFSSTQHAKKLSSFYRQQKPDLIVNTYFLFKHALENISAAKNIPLINIITDPRTIHPILISDKANTNMIFDEKLRQICNGFCPDAACCALGWFVREHFQQSYDKKAVRHQLGLDENMLTFLISSGSEGANAVSLILPSLIASQKPVQVVVACGANKTLLQTVKALDKVLRTKDHKSKIIPIGFSSQMHAYMQAADLVVGKAGPNTLFESVATLTPFFAITHIAGQEDGNLDVIREYNLGYVEENPMKAIKILKNIISAPEQLDAFEKDLKKMAKYNESAREKLLKYVNELLN